MRRLFPVLGWFACALAAQGCELAANFDRDKIPGLDAAIEAGVPDEDAGAEDAGADAGLADAAAPTDDDAGNDDGGP